MDLDAPPLTIGVLAMQGAFREHVRMLGQLGVEAREVRTVADLEDLDGIIIPGGESTTMRKLMARSALHETLGARLREGLPALGTCAGLIVLAHAAADGAPATYGLLDVTVARNAWGRQTHSFEGPVALTSEDGSTGTVPGIFIRAPRIESVGSGVEIIGRFAEEPVAVCSGSLMGCTFHPELTQDTTLHRMFIGQCATRAGDQREQHVGA